jgi:hypothetical protein
MESGSSLGKDRKLEISSVVFWGRCCWALLSCQFSSSELVLSNIQCVLMSSKLDVHAAVLRFREH